MIPSYCDVLIVGAGPAGMALAITLAQSGIRPLIVEKSEVAQTTSRAAVLHAHTLEVLEKLDVVGPMLAEGVRVKNFAFRDRDELLGLVRFDDLPSAHKYLLMLPQERTEAILLARLSRLGVTIIRGAAFTALREEAGLVRAKLETAAGTAMICARYLVGADGMHSAVRKACGIPFDGAPYEGSFALADVRIEGMQKADEVTLFFSPDGMVVVAPLPGGRYRIVATAEEGPEKPDATFVQSLLDSRGPALQPLGRVTEVFWSSRFRLHHRLAREYRKGNVFIVGDAAHAHSPAGGQGMNTGLVDAYTLGRLLADDLLGRASPGALDRYEELRRPAARKVLHLAGRLTAAATLRSRRLRWLRNFALSMAAKLPRFRQRLALNLSGISRRSAALMN